MIAACHVNEFSEVAGHNIWHVMFPVFRQLQQPEPMLQEQQVSHGLRHLVDGLTEQLALRQNAGTVQHRQDAHREVHWERDFPQAEVRSPQQAPLHVLAVIRGAQCCLTWLSLTPNTPGVMLLVAFQLYLPLCGPVLLDVYFMIRRLSTPYMRHGGL